MQREEDKCIYVCIYIERERKKESERENWSKRDEVKERSREKETE